VKVEIDEILCSGHGRCYMLAKDVYRLDDNGYNADRGLVIEVPEAREAGAMLGVRNCPEAAITVLDDH
jgi:ferredoxin